MHGYIAEITLILNKRLSMDIVCPIKIKNGPNKFK